MRPGHFLLMCLCCLIWGGNFVLSRWILADYGIPPFFFAFLRFVLLSVLMFPFLFPLPEKFFYLAGAALCMGAGHLAFLYTGLQTASASSGAIVSQMLIPFATILSVIFLKEKIGLWRLTGILGALAGVFILIYDPQDVRLDVGLVFIAVAFFSAAVASILIKRVGDVSPMQYLAWMGVLAVPVSGLATLVAETGRIALAGQAGWVLGVGVVYAVVLASICAHGLYFFLLKRYDVTLIVPLNLMTPVWAVILGITLLGEDFGLRAVIGAVLVMGSVLLITGRQKQSAGIYP